MFETCTDKKSAMKKLDEKIAYYVSPEGVDYWRMYNQESSTLDTASFLALVGYRKKEFTVEWARYGTTKVKVGSHTEISGYSGDADEDGHVELTPDYVTVDDYEDREYLADSGEVSDTIYYCFPSNLCEAKKLRDEFSKDWLWFYSKNKMREYPEGYYLNIKNNTFDKNKFHFWKEKETKEFIAHYRLVNLPFLLLSFILIVTLILSFLFSLSSFTFSDFSSIKYAIVFKDSYLHLKGEFNYTLFYSVWGGVTALHIVCCSFYGKQSSWWLLIVFLVTLILGPLISTVVFYGVLGKSSGFDFFALILACFSTLLGFVIFLVLFIDWLTFGPIVSKARAKENQNNKELMEFFMDFQKKGIIKKYFDYLNRWSLITGKPING